MDGWTGGVRDRRKEGRLNVRTEGRKGEKGGKGDMKDRNGGVEDGRAV